jgi:hypothetical protein
MVTSYSGSFSPQIIVSVMAMLNVLKIITVLLKSNKNMRINLCIRNITIKSNRAACGRLLLKALYAKWYRCFIVKIGLYFTLLMYLNWSG